MTEPTAQQRRVIEHGDGSCRVMGGFGTGKTAALAARAARLRDEGRQVVEIDAKAPARFALELLARHGARPHLLAPDEQRAIVREVLTIDGPRAWPAWGDSIDHAGFADELAATVLAYEGSFLGEEELFVHADAAGQLATWAELARFARRYRTELDARGAIDRVGALVAASLLLRDPDVRAREQAQVDDMIVDDYQAATFATARLVAQLTGPGANLVVAGNTRAAITGNGDHLRAFTRRFAAVDDIELEAPFRRPSIPALRIVDQPGGEMAVVDDLRRQAAARGLAPESVAVLHRHPPAGVSAIPIDDSVGREWPFVVVAGATEGILPATRTRPRWFDTEILSGPDLPSDDVRDERWLARERRRFAVACSRATEWLVVVSALPVTRFVSDLIADAG